MHRRSNSGNQVAGQAAGQTSGQGAGYGYGAGSAAAGPAGMRTVTPGYSLVRVTDSTGQAMPPSAAMIREKDKSVPLWRRWWWEVTSLKFLQVRVGVRSSGMWQVAWGLPLAGPPPLSIATIPSLTSILIC